MADLKLRLLERIVPSRSSAQPDSNLPGETTELHKKTSVRLSRTGSASTVIWQPVQISQSDKNEELACIAHKSRCRLEIAQPSPVSMPALERHVRLAGEVKNQQNNEPHQINERQAVAITGWPRFETMPEPRNGLMK